MKPLFKLLGIAGSLRADSFSQLILNALTKAAAPWALVEHAGIGLLPHYNQDLEADLPEVVAEFKRKVADADGVLLVTPEYNHGIPGVLKNALDWGSRPSFASPFKDKPVLIVTSSLAFTGGVRAQGQLRETLVSMLARPVVTPEIVVASVHRKVADGRLADQTTIDFAMKGVDALLDHIRVQEHRAAVDFAA